MPSPSHLNFALSPSFDPNGPNLAKPGQGAMSKVTANPNKLLMTIYSISLDMFVGSVDLYSQYLCLQESRMCIKIITNIHTPHISIVPTL